MNCPYCFNGLCQKHPLQDHGASMKKIEPEKKKSVMNALFDSMVKQRLDRAKLEEAKMKEENDTLTFSSRDRVSS